MFRLSDVILIFLCTISITFANNINKLLKQFNEEKSIVTNRFLMPQGFEKYQEHIDILIKKPIFDKNVLQATVFVKKANQWRNIPLKESTFISGWKVDNYDLLNANQIMNVLKQTNFKPLFHDCMREIINKFNNKMKNYWTIGKSFSPGSYQESNLNIMKKDITLIGVASLLNIKNNLNNNQILKDNIEKLNNIKSKIIDYFCIFTPNNNLVLRGYSAYQDLCLMDYNEEKLKNFFNQPPMKLNNNKDGFFLNSQVEQTFSHTEHALMSYILFSENNITDYNETECPDEIILYLYSRLPACNHCHPSLSFFTIYGNRDTIKKRLLNCYCEHTKFYILYKAAFIPGYVRYENEDT